MLLGPLAVLVYCSFSFVQVASVGHVMRGRAGGAVSPKPHSPVLQAMDLQVTVVCLCCIIHWQAIPMFAFTVGNIQP